jgi:hypothetical protein
MLGALDVEQFRTGAQRPREVLGETSMFGPVCQKVDDECTGAVHRIRQLGVGSDQTEQPTGVALREYQGRNGESRPIVVTCCPHRDRCR